MANWAQFKDDPALCLPQRKNIYLLSFTLGKCRREQVKKENKTGRENGCPPFYFRQGSREYLKKYYGGKNHLALQNNQRQMLHYGLLAHKMPIKQEKTIPWPTALFFISKLSRYVFNFSLTAGNWAKVYRG
ncbi:MAG: hypothetical protein ACR5LG_07410 [Sodalis sp. (in: enterobacteria)]|uniref:hypothetical protein n=1 Tax=Sodalis sp. (in: enterobacteria) TaxID=1898979 RepID=UPI003F2F534D